MSTILEQWNTFLCGHWQKSMPQKEGSFPIKALDGKGGTLPGIHFELVYLDPKTQEFKSVYGWGGLWWSEPQPKEMPLRPEDRLDE